MIPILMPCIRTVRSLFAKQVGVTALWVRGLRSAPVGAERMSTGHPFSTPRTALEVSWLNGTAAVSKTAIPQGYPGSNPGLTVWQINPNW